MTNDSRPLSTLLTVDDLREWQRAIREIDSRISSLTSERADYERKMQAAAMLFDVETLLQEVPLGRKEDRAAAASPPSEAYAATKMGGWPNVVRRVVAEATEGITTADLRTAVGLGAPADSPGKGPKGFYTAVERVKMRGQITRYKGRLFTPDNLAAFLERVAAGEATDIDEKRERGASRFSEFQVVALGILDNFTDGITSANWIAEIAKNSEHADAIKRNKTYAYNVFSSFIKHGHVRKVGELYFPRKENEPPAGEPRDGSETDEVSASSSTG